MIQKLHIGYLNVNFKIILKWTLPPQKCKFGHHLLSHILFFPNGTYNESQ